MRAFVQRLMENSIIRFILVGGCSTLIDFSIYMLLSVPFDIDISKGVSMVCSSLFSYLANKNFTFTNKKKTNIRLMVKYYVVFGANFAINLGMNRLVYENTGSKVIAFVCATICGMTVNYLGQRFIVFA